MPLLETPSGVRPQSGKSKARIRSVYDARALAERWIQYGAEEVFRSEGIRLYSVGAVLLDFAERVEDSPIRSVFEKKGEKAQQGGEEMINQVEWGWCVEA